MIGLIVAIILLNFIAFKTNKRLTTNQIIHIWTFTIAMQVLGDTYIVAKYHAYWYFSRDIDWKSILALLALIPPVNMMFVNWYPFKHKVIKRVLYLIFWVKGIVLYEAITLFPEPWGYFHYGWWNLWYSAIIDPVLLLIVLGYYKWISKVENKLLANKNQK